MSLSGGTRLGSYEVLAAIGAGGMGEVYRARDLRLGREVAIKVLPTHLTADPAARARFEREARTVSNLNHPHICTLHDVGRDGETDYLVLELVEGETLLARIARGPLPTAEVIRIGMQIADALDRAHRAGVIHRDLKPGNVMLTRSGAKLLDFGLARPGAPAVTMGGSSVTMAVSGTPSPPGTVPLTEAGTIVGTFQYMAPEQLEGAEADPRSDLWALGCVLYEMATGKPAFTARSPASLVSAILSSEPAPVSQLAPLSPPALDRVVAACLAKDPADRVQSAHDVKLQLGWLADPSSGWGSIHAAQPARRRRVPAWLPLAAVAVSGLVLGAALVALRSRPASAPAPAFFEVPLPAAMRIRPWQSSSVLSPDGGTIVVTARREGEPSLWLKRLDSLEPIEIPGSRGAMSPAWSPDGRSIAYKAQGRGSDHALFRFSPGDESPTRICDMSDCRGVAWGGDDVLVFAPSAAGPLWRVPAGGGVPVQATWLDSTRGEASHRFPHFLPDGKHFLFVALPAGPRGFPVYAGTLGSRTVRHVLDAECVPTYAEPGYLVFVDGGKIVAQKFDAKRLAVSGPRVPLADAPGTTDMTAEPVVSASRGGRLLTLALVPPTMRMEWFDRAGASRGVVPLPAGDWRVLELSSDQRFALALREGGLWRVDLERAVVTRIVRRFEPPLALSPDGERIAYAAGLGASNAAVIRSDGRGAADSVVTMPALFQEVVDWSPDGTLMIAVLGRAEEQRHEESWDLWTVPLDPAGTRRPYATSPLLERIARISPDGRWVAYGAGDGSQIDFFLDAFPEPVRAVPLVAGRAYRNLWLLWGRNGREVLFNDAEQALLSVAVVPEGGTVRVGAPVRLFDLPPGTTGIRTRDGERFLITHPFGTPTAPALRLVEDWTGLLERAVR